MERTRAIRAAINQVPSGVPIVSTNHIGAHLSERRHVYLFPIQSNAEWAIIDSNDAWLEVAGEQVDEDLFRQLMAAFESSGNWQLLYDKEGVRVYRKRP